MRRRLLTLAVLVHAAGAQAQTAGASGAISALLAQAHYWQAQNQPGQSLAALGRVLQLDPANADALALRIKIELDQGDNVAAAQDLATLKQVQPANAGIPALQRMQTEAANPVDTQSLDAARAATKSGHYADAVNLYQQSFHGGTPPSAYAVEYYQTLAGTPDGYAAALAALAALVTDNPNNLHAQLAYAQVQTYQPAARADGIARLVSLTNYHAIAADAAAAWRQALTFLPETPASVPQYQAYLTKYPNDVTVQALLTAATAPPVLSPAAHEADNRARGFDALNAGQPGTAAALFQAALAVNPGDADALGGLGLVKLRQGDTTAASTLLQQAIAANPAEQAKWQQALHGAMRAASYATATSLLNQGDLDGAAGQLNAIIAGGGDLAGAEAMLADVRTRQGDLPAAAAAWREVLASDPNNGPALAGLGSILARQGDQQGAAALFQQAQAGGQGAAVAGAQAELLRSQAQQAADPAVALSLYRAAVAAAPDDPWARLDLARALRAAGQTVEARQQMDALIAEPEPSTAALQAGALFAAEDDRLADATALVARLPPSALTPDMLAIQSSGALDQQIANAQAQAAGNPALTRQLLVTMAAAPDPTGRRGAAIATALVKQSDPEGAQLAIQAAVAANPGAGAAALLTYAGAMLAGGQDQSAGEIVQSLQARGGLTPEQQAAVASLRDGLAVRASDRLAAQGHLAEAYNQLAPGLAQAPQDPVLNTALARLYQANHQPLQALAINQALLHGDPENLDARDGAVNAAIAAANWATATQLVQDGEAAQPNEPRIWLMAANLARAQGNDGAALDDLNTAQNLRQQQLIAQSGGGAIALAAAAPVAVNPFGNSAAATADAGPPILGASSGIYTVAPLQTDALTQQIAAQIATLQTANTPSIQAGITLDSRSGSAGLDQLETVGTPLTGVYSPHGTGTMTVTVTPTFLAAGQVSSDPTSQSKFGAAALGAAAKPGSQTAAGVAVSAAYDLPWLKASAGSTPFGFRTENIVGALELDPQLAPGLRLSLRAERQAVTDSLLSYAATTDPRSGATWGGVLRDRAYAQLSLSAGPGYVYAGGGADQLTGKGVAKNTEIEFGAGGGYPVYQTGDANAKLGVNITYFAYNRNLRYFTLGQGGYFSPQSYFAATLPLDYQETDGGLTWTAGGTIGVQSYSENSSPYFPHDAGLQAQLEAAAVNSSYLQAYYPSDTNSGIIGGAHGSFEYRLNRVILVGGSLTYNRAGNWNDAQALVYARYLLGSAP
jgi:Tfp pilus assembly protein PilF